MKKLFAVFLLLLAVSFVRAATVTGTLEDTNGDAVQTRITFDSLSAPISDPPNTIVRTRLVMTNDTDGTFSVTLAQGNYTVRINSTQVTGFDTQFNIYVPGGAGTYDLTELVDTVGDLYQPSLTVQDGSTIMRSPTNITVSGATISSNAPYSMTLTISASGSTNMLYAGVGSLDVTNSFKLQNATASRAAVFDANKLLTNSATTATELGYLSGVTNAVQTQLDSKRSWQPPVTNGLVLYAHPQSGYTLSGIEVSQWDDASGLGNHLTQSTSTNRPWAVGPGSPVFWTPNDIANTTNKYLSIPAGVAITTTNFSAFAVVHQANSYYTQGLIEWNGSGDAALIAGWANSTNSQRGQLASANTTQRVTTNTHSSSLRLVGIVGGYDYTALYDNGLAGIFAANTAADRTGGELGRFDDAYPFMGNMYSVMVFNRTLTADEVEQLKLWAWHTFDARPRGPKQVIFDGDSITTGYGQTDGGSIAQQIATAETDWRTVNFAQPSVHLTNLMTAASTIIDPLFDSNAGNNNNIVVIFAGSNDLNGSVTAADLWSNVQTYATARRAAGFKVVGVSLLPRDNNGGFDTKRLAFNALIRADWATYMDGFADIGADPFIGDQADSLDTRYYLDEVHLTALGSSIAAKYIRAAIRDIENVTIGGTLAVTGTVTSTGGFVGSGASLTAVNAATGDNATAFFSAGTIEHERGGLEADVSAYAGLVKISGGATSQAVAGTDYLTPTGSGAGLTGLPLAFSDAADPVVLSTTTKDVAIGAAAINSAKLSVDGDADQVQFAIQGHSTQTANLFELENNSGTVVASIGPTGAISAGSGTSGTLSLGGVNVIVNTAGAVELTGIDSLDAGTETAIEAAIDALVGPSITGDMTLSSDTVILLNTTLPTDGSNSGKAIPGTAGATLAFGDLVVLDVTDSRWELADANSASGADGDARGLIGICILAAASDGSATAVLLEGMVRADTAFPTFTVNTPIFVSETAGDVTATSPTTSGNVVRRLGTAFTADSMYFNPGDFGTYVP